MFGRLVLVALVVGACGGATRAPDRPPAMVVGEWADAIARDDPRAGYGLLAASVRKEVSFELFAQRWRESRPERERQAIALKATLREDPRLGERARLVLTDGKAANLVHERAGWRMDNPLLGGAYAGSPQDALRQFAASVEGHSFEAVMRLLTSTRRDGLKQVLADFTKGLEEHIAEGIEIQGNTAKLRWSDGKQAWEVVLKKEDGQWRVDDVKRP